MSFSKETEVSDMNQTTPKKRLHVEEESQKKRQRRTIADCVFVVLKHSLLESLNWMDNNRKHFYCAAEKGKDVANAG